MEVSRSDDEVTDTASESDNEQSRGSSAAVTPVSDGKVLHRFQHHQTPPHHSVSRSRSTGGRYHVSVGSSAQGRVNLEALHLGRYFNDLKYCLFVVIVR